MVVNLPNILPIKVVGTISGTAAAGTPTSIFSLAAIQNVVIVNEDPLEVNLTTSSGFVGATADAAGESGLVPTPASGTQGDFLTGGATFRKIRLGVANLGDIDTSDKSVTVEGDLTSASWDGQDASGIAIGSLTVVFPDIGSTDYMVQLSFEGLTGGALDNDNEFTEQPLIHTRTSTGFLVFLRESTSVAQNLRVHILVIGF